MLRRKGFTLIELIIVIAILSVLGLLLMPQISGYVGSSKDVVCTNNLNTLNRIYRQELAHNPSVSAQEILTNEGGQFFGGKGQCPAEGTYSVFNNVIICSQHVQTNGNPEDSAILDLKNKMNEMLIQYQTCFGMDKGTDERKECFQALYQSENTNGESFSNDRFLQAIFKYYGNTWKEIEPSLMETLGAKNQLYARPFYTAETNLPLIFASESNTPTGSWYCNAVYYNGSWYKKSNNSNFSVTDFNNKTEKQIEMMLKSTGGFVKVK